MVEERMHAALNGGDRTRIDDALALALSILSEGEPGARVRDVSTGRSHPVGATWRLPDVGAVSISIADMLRIDVFRHEGGCVSLREPVRRDRRNVFDVRDAAEASNAIALLRAAVEGAFDEDPRTALDQLRLLSDALPAIREWRIDQINGNEARYQSLAMRLPSPYAPAEGAYRRDLPAARLAGRAWFHANSGVSSGKADGDMEPGVARWLDRVLSVSRIQPVALEVGRRPLGLGHSAWAVGPVSIAIDSLTEIATRDPVELVRAVRDIGPLRLMAA